MTTIIDVRNVNKRYASGHEALSDVSLSIERGEIFALLGPNGAGKTTLISAICGIVNASSGNIVIDGHDNRKDFRSARKCVGLVPQELALSMFESVWATVRFSRGLFGMAHDDTYLEQLLKELSLWEKKDQRITRLSGGMKRRLLIAKALAHQPKVLFLDEPSAGVDVELRRDMWEMIHRLRANGTTIILTTHYIEEAEELADRIGVINKGKVVLVESKQSLMKKLGKKQLSVQLCQAPAELPAPLQAFDLELNEKGQLTYTFSRDDEASRVPQLLKALDKSGLEFIDLKTSESSLEDIFVDLIGAKK